ncbi:MAG: helicase-related protein [Proteobacteria bacterium]|nr:helicase-related protein [Pseudomonadota bacterium]
MTRVDLGSATGRSVAVLGPTNTGKTHLAVERMLGHRNGIIGLPLRLLAREIYERVAAVRGRTRVALITGEEKIMPPNAAYVVCTVEAMPLDRDFAFVAIDEIQLAADPERGHVFTDRLLHARGYEETMFLGSETIRPLIKKLVPRVEFVSRPRFSKLTYAGTKKLSRLPPRSAIVAFTASDVYAIAEMVRRHRGGAAVVLGALSPRSRNAQVALFEEGQVDYMVATDAIGMGLNLNVNHVAFAALRKFDGRNTRPLRPAELGQIAGRAGRYMNEGTFGCTADAGEIEPEIVEAIENHQFPNLRTIFWRETDIDYGSLRGLIRSLERRPERRELAAAPIAEDLATLRAMADAPDIASRVTSTAALRLLWEVCQIPDYRKTMADVHTRMLAQIFLHLHADEARLPTDWLAAQVDRLDRTDGDIDALATRIAHVRTWTYVSHRAEWIADATHWQERARAIEDRLSDALHERITQRFVDRRTSTLTKRLKDNAELIAAVAEDGDVLVEGHSVGRIEGLKFVPESHARDADGRTLRAAAVRALANPIAERAAALAQDDDSAFALSDEGQLSWQNTPVAVLSAGQDLLSPHVALLPNDLLHGSARVRVQRRLEAWIAQYLARHLAPIRAIRTSDLSPPARGLVYQLVQALGCLINGQAAPQLAALNADDKKLLTTRGVHLGTQAIYLPAMFKPARRNLLARLWKLTYPGVDIEVPEGGAASVPVVSGRDAKLLSALGFVAVGARAIRIDLVDRIRRDLHRFARRRNKVQLHELMALVGCPRDEFASVLAALGFRALDTDTGTVIEPLPKERKPGPAKPNRKRRPKLAPHPDSPFAVLSHLQVKPTRP